MQRPPVEESNIVGTIIYSVPIHPIHSKLDKSDEWDAINDGPYNREHYRFWLLKFIIGKAGPHLECPKKFVHPHNLSLQRSSINPLQQQQPQQQ